MFCTQCKCYITAPMVLFITQYTKLVERNVCDKISSLCVIIARVINLIKIIYKKTF
jgi:hypothetical protein